MATQAECAKHIDISDRRFRELVDAGVFERADKGQYDLDAVRIAYIRNLRDEAAGRGGGEAQANKAREDARLAKLKADKAELEMQEMRGELVRADQVGDAISAAVQTMRTRILAVPAKIAQRVGAKDTRHAEKVARDEICEALEALAAVQVVGKR